MVLLRNTFTPVACDEQVISQAIDSGMKDEDAIQYFSALRSIAAVLITRNPDHFPRSPLSVVTPANCICLPRPDCGAVAGGVSLVPGKLGGGNLGVEAF